jgi:hypothetical protein
MADAQRGLRSVLFLASASLAACASPLIPADAVVPTPASIAAEPAVAPASGAHLGEELRYGIALAGLPVGDATLTTAARGDGVEIEVAGETNSVVDLFCDIRGVARSRLDGTGRSQDFYLWMDEDGKSSERALAFRDTPCLYYKPFDDEAWVAALTQYRAPRDPLSLLNELRRLEPDTEPRDFEVAMTLRSFCYRARYRGRADVSVGAGDFRDALLWRIEVRPYRQLETDATPIDVGPVVGFYDVALSADAARLPLRVERAFGFGQVVLELERFGPADAGLAALPLDATPTSVAAGFGDAASRAPAR